MQLLLDECVDERLRHSFEGHVCHSARFAGLTGLKNGALLTAAESAGFDAIVTIDRQIPYQQDLRLRRISIVVLCGATNRLRDLKVLIPAALRALSSIKPGEAVTIFTEA